MRSCVTYVWIVCLVLAGTVSHAADDEGKTESGWRYHRALIYDSEDGDFQMRIKSRVQARARAEFPELGDDEMSFDISRAQLSVSGWTFRDWKYRLQLNFTDNDLSTNVLQDAWFQYTKQPLAQMWVGQGKVFFARQYLTSTGKFQFVDVSLATFEFGRAPGSVDSRDVGIALVGQNKRKTYGYQVGLYNGSGINKDEDDNIDFMVVGRLVFTPFGEFKLAETDLSRPRSPKLAIGVSVRAINSGTESISEDRRDTTANFEFAYAMHGLNVVAEFYTRSADQPFSPPDEEDTDGWYAQVGWLFKNRLEAAGRYSEIIRRDVPDDDATEAGLALNYYIHGNDLKLQTDFRLLRFEGVQASPDIDRDVFRVQLQLAF